jgi:hypothetical protein
MNKKALAPFSGGLDSILACRVIQDQNIQVQGVQFVTPFFHYDLLQRRGYVEHIKKKYDISVIVKDISDSYLPMLRNPVHGYGKYFNPCIDCKILMVREIKKMMDQFKASFIISGEVVGQRPMSQRKDTMRIIERDSESEGVLFRPLCAASAVKPCKVVTDNIIDCQKLPSFSGRGRDGQIKLAAKLGITDFPNPGGGCVLADPALSKRIRAVFIDKHDVTVSDISFLLLGRQFLLPHGGWLTLGRDQQENSRVEALNASGDYLLNMKDRPGPMALLRYLSHDDDLALAAGLVARFAKKVNNRPAAGVVKITRNGEVSELGVEPCFADLSSWQR